MNCVTYQACLTEILAFLKYICNLRVMEGDNVKSFVQWGSVYG